MSPKDGQKATNVGPMSTQTQTRNILSRAAAKISCHEEEEKFPERGDIGRHWSTSIPYRYPPLPCALPSAPQRRAQPAHRLGPKCRAAAPPPAGTVNLKSPQLQKPHVPSTLVRKCARSTSRTGRSCIDARRIEYIFRQQTSAMGTRECEQSARRVISITQLAVARPDKEASRKERPGPPERLPHAIQEMRLSGDRTPPLKFRKDRTRPTWQDLNGQESVSELSCNST